MDNDQFQAERRLGIGGSDAAALLGMHPFKTIHDVYMEKVGLADPPEPTERMKNGSWLEPVLRERFMNETRQSVEIVEQQIRHPNADFIRGHIDGLILGNGAGNGILEIKTVDARYAWMWGDVQTDEIPKHVIIQCQHYMAIMGLTWTAVPVLVGGNDFRIYNIDRNDQLIKKLLRTEKEFWQNHVYPKIPPPIDGTESAKKLLSKLYPRHADETVIANEKVNELVTRYFDLRDDLATTEDKCRELENEIKLQMKAASLMTGPGWRISWKTTKDRTKVDYKAILADAQVPQEIIETHTKMEPGTRPFRATRTKGE